MSGSQNPLRPSRTPATPSSRPPSLRPIRDLTLGGGTTSMSSSSPHSQTPSVPQQPSTRAKFTPNLAAAGRRQTPAPTPTPATDSGPSKRGRGRGGGRGGRGRGRGARYEPEIIQSKGIFSEGLAETDARKTRGADLEGGSVSRRGDYESRDRSKARGGVKSEAMETDEQALKYLMKDDFMASTYGADRIKPIALPLRSSGQKEKMDAQETFPVPMDVDVKPDSSCNVPLDEKPNLSAVGASTLVSSLPPAFQELFTSTDEKSGQGSLFFVQLPNILSHTIVTSGMPLENAPRDCSVKAEIVDADEQITVNGQSIKAEPADSQATDIPAESPDEKPPKSWHHALDDIPPGRIGKLQLMKSGRVRLKLNEARQEEPLVFDANPGTKTSFLQQVVVIKTDREAAEERGALYVLGDVDHRLLFTPKIDNLLANLKQMPH